MNEIKSSQSSWALKGNIFPIIGMGASAGGLETFSKFFKNMPKDSGMAFVLIQHLDPTHASNLAELLSRSTEIPVNEATNETKIKPDHIYIIPPNWNMTIHNRALLLIEANERPGISHNIDLFFGSMANDLGENAIVIILSGTGTDGTEGARTVQAKRGVVMVEDPETAKYDGMPESVISKDIADFVQPVEELPGQLIDYVQKYFGKKFTERVDKKKIDTLNHILLFIKEKTNKDFSQYKTSTIKRRIYRRMGLNRIDNIEEYLKYLINNPAEVDAASQDFLINVTSFFRDEPAYSALKEHLKERIMQKKPDHTDIRAWIPGCSTGEEAYSTAIIIHEAMEELKKTFKLQIFCTDIDNEAIEVARRGSYDPNVMKDISTKRLEKYFKKDESEQYTIKKRIREELVFAIQDVTIDPSFTRLDLIVARNLLIYFNINLQNKLIPIFNYSLNEKGLLFMGTAETIGKFTEFFSPLDRKWKIYESNKKMKNLPQVVTEPVIIPKINPYNNQKQKASNEVNPEKMLLRALAPSLLLDSNYNITYLHGDVSKYLRLPEGVPKISVLNLIRDEYRSFLVAGLKEAKSGRIPVTDEIVSSEKGTKRESVLVTIKPIQPEKDSKGGTIITFEQGIEKNTKEHKEEKEDIVKSLENKLKHARQTLRNTVEELESSNEELRSANEEYQSTNEELQSTNEELETSREELQSVNEELTTINFEHQKKIEELATLNDDVKNLLNSTGIATVFLDNNLKLLRYTPKASKIFNFLETDSGRPLSDITHKVKDIDMELDVQRVLESLKGIEKRVRMDDGKSYILRIYPYRTVENRIAGVGITLIDVGKKQPPEIDFNCLKLIFEEIRQPLLLLDDNLKVLMANKAFYDYFSAKPGKIKGKKLFQLDKHWDTPELKKKLEKTLTQGVRFSDFTIKYRTSDKKNEEFFLNGKRVYDNKRNSQLLFLAISD